MFPFGDCSIELLAAYGGGRGSCRWWPWRDGSRSGSEVVCCLGLGVDNLDKGIRSLREKGMRVMDSGVYGDN